MLIQEYSGMGTYHMRGGGENEDTVCHADKNGVAVISLADGVSSCSRAKTGAETACRAITDLLFKKGNCFLDFEGEQIMDFALSHIRYELERKVAADAGEFEDYSSTVASVFVNGRKGKMLCFNLGDSVIMAVGNGKCRVLAAPLDSSEGSCVTTTVNAGSMAFVKIFDCAPIDSVVICSDGAWREMFNRNKLKPEVTKLLSDNDYAGLESFLSSRECFDDNSFISLDMRKPARRMPA